MNPGRNTGIFYWWFQLEFICLLYEINRSTTAATSTQIWAALSFVDVRVIKKIEEKQKRVSGPVRNDGAFYL
jgi:hypothetical protein